MARNMKVKKLNDRMKKIFKGKRWMQDLNIQFMDEKSVVAFGHMLTEIELLREQVEGLEKIIKKI